MIIDTETARAHGYQDYGFDDVCPYCYDDLKESWWSGWWNAMAACVVFRYLSNAQ